MGFSNLLSICVLGYVYGTVFKVSDFRAYIVYLGLGITAWGMIAGSLGAAPQLFEVNSRHLHNSNINPVFYTLEEWAFQVQTFAQTLLVVALALLFFQPSIVPHLFTAGLLPLLNLLLFCYWLPLLVCLLGARFHDVYQLVPIALQLIFLLSPILYKREALGHAQWITTINPLYLLIDQFRSALITGQLALPFNVGLLGANILGFFLAVVLLDRSRKSLPFLF